ncbi:MAG: PQQ-binding-like beta-propeller repeat protein [Alphaproteobacteria bacterium]
MILRRSLQFAFLLALALAACSEVSSNPPAGDGGAPPEVVAAARDWPLPGRDYRNSRATFDTRIDSRTIASVAQAWKVDMPGAGGYGNASTTPLVLGDTVYVEDLTSVTRAIDLATGAVRWKTQAYGPTIGPNGVAVGWGKVFANKGTDRVNALDLATGAEVWERPISRTETEGIDIQPQVWDDKVYVSSVPVSLDGIYVGGDRGVLYALSEADGSTRWSFDTVASPDLWGNPEVNSGGGAWFPPSVDVSTGSMFWGIANPAPFPGTAAFPNGSSRPGPNLYTESTVSIDARSGELQWYNQAIPHDIFDHDMILTMVVDAKIGGRTRTIVVGTGKMGRVYGYDRESGQLLWSTPVGKHENDELTELVGPTVVFPGTFGGVITPPAHADGIVYCAVINAPSTYFPNRPGYFGSDIGTNDGQVVAIDASTGAILWDVFVPGDPFGGATVVNDLVLTGTFQGQILALDRATGRTVWTWEAPGGINGWPAVARDTILWPIGLASPAQLVALHLP